MELIARLQSIAEAAPTAYMRTAFEEAATELAAIREIVVNATPEHMPVRDDTPTSEALHTYLCASWS